MMKEQLIFSSTYTERLFKDLVEKEKINEYERTELELEELYPIGGTGIFIPERIKLEVPEGNDLKDLENTKIIYGTYKTLSPSQASDPRLWTYLTHVPFFDYMKQRWPVRKAKKPLNRIKDRFFLRQVNLRGLTRNGISRLWWYGYLTYDESRDDPWELTSIMLKRADLTVGITERAAGSAENVRTAILEFLNSNQDILNNEDKTRDLLKKVNLFGGVKNLPFLDKEEIYSSLGLFKE